uniref:Uncharacterized protein n=1 Tax=uncultured Alphaproteobacteria bacterium TaxID=91750 RepID=A0A6G8F288_9PROT|nr:hypothetical protein PlAlph_2860 [uncultured Alphaproteobacteria bacterium]
MPNFILNIRSAEDELFLSDSFLQCYLLNSEIEQNALKCLCEKLLNAGKIVLLFGARALDLCAPLKADGVLLDLSASENIKRDMASARSLIKGGILGVVSRNRRHEAMIASENEPDFIVFKIWKDGSAQTLELSKWYNEFFLLQQAVMPQDDRADFEQYPSDMVILTPQDYKIFVAKK